MEHIYIRIEKVQVQFCIGAIKKLPIGETIERRCSSIARRDSAVKDGQRRKKNSFHCHLPLNSGTGKGKGWEREREEERKKKWKKEKNNTGGNSERLNYYVRTLQLNRSRIPPSPRLTDNNAKVVRTFTDKDLGQKYGRLQTNRAVAFSTGCRNFQGLSTFSTALPFFLSFFLPLVPRPSTRPQLSSHAFPRRSAG